MMRLWWKGMGGGCNELENPIGIETLAQKEWIFSQMLWVATNLKTR